ASGNCAPAPAPLSTTGSSPRPTMCLTLSGDAATRRSCARRSLTIATFIAGRSLAVRVLRQASASAAAHNAARRPLCEERRPADLDGVGQRPVWRLRRRVLGCDTATAYRGTHRR